MKRIALSLCFLLMLVSLVRAQSDWLSYKIDSKLSVKVPSARTAADEYSVISMTKDSMLCVIAKIDMQKVSGLDSTALAGIAATNDFLSIIKTGMQEKMQGYTMSDVKMGKWNNYYCYNIDGSNPTSKVKSFSFMVIIGDYLYSLGTVMPESRSTQPKDDFFASLKLN